jgi:nucleotide-binding universal stress UspA family protein
MYRNVVVAYDGSEGAKAALARAAEVADRDGSSLTLVEAVAGKVPSPAPGGPPLAKPERRAMARGDLNAAIETVNPELQAGGWVIGGPPASGIVTVAEDIEADLIVTGSHARGAIARTVLGSVSTEILHHAPCDVLVVHPPAGDRAA